MELKPGLTFVGTSAIDEVTKELTARGIKTFVLDPQPESDGVFEEIRRVLPLDPPVEEVSWDALSDSLFEALSELDPESMAIVWPDASRNRSSDKSDYQTAVDVLEEVAGQLADPEMNPDAPKTVYVYIGRD